MILAAIDQGSFWLGVACALLPLSISFLLS